MIHNQVYTSFFVQNLHEHKYLVNEPLMFNNVVGTKTGLKEEGVLENIFSCFSLKRFLST